jgi:tetratricopeptide (TPR) repeat protein
MAKDKTEERSTGDIIADFLHKYRRSFWIFIIIIVAGAAGSVAYFSIRNILEKKAIEKVETFEERKNNLGTFNDTSKPPELETLLEEIIAFAPSTFGYAAARSYSLAADIYFSLGEWNKAEDTWKTAAQKAPKIYLAPISLFNAAIAAEEQGNLEAAIDYYEQSIEFTGIYPAAARARFNIGRIREALHDNTGAAAAYKVLIEKNPDSNWAKLAQSRIIYLEKD